MFGQRARLKRPCSMSKPSPLLQGLSCRRGQFLDNEHGHLFCRDFVYDNNIIIEAIKPKKAKSLK